MVVGGAQRLSVHGLRSMGCFFRDGPASAFRKSPFAEQLAANTPNRNRASSRRSSSALPLFLS